MKRKNAGKLPDDFLSQISEVFQGLGLSPPQETPAEARRRKNLEKLLNRNEPGDDSGHLTAWLVGLEQVRAGHSADTAVRGTRLRGQFNLTGLDPEGFVRCDFVTPFERQQVFLTFDFASQQVGGGCSCPRSRESRPCEHTYAFAEYLLGEVRLESSPLRQALLDNDASGFAQSLHLDSVLKRVDRFLQTQTPDDGTKSAELAADESVIRLAWNLEVGEHRAQLVPLKQKRKKRGTGWTKGQQIAVSTLRQATDLITSPADQRVVAAIREGDKSHYSYYLRPEWTIDLVEALDGLVGHDAVLLNGQPAQVRRHALALRVVDQGQQLSLTLAFPSGNDDPDWVATFLANGVVMWDATQPLILVCRCEQAVARLVEHLGDETLFPRERLDDVLRRLEGLQAHLPVELPESLAGPLVEDPTTPVLLLRSSQQGFLDCGMRVKDSRGRIHLPGEGPLGYAGKRDEQPVQYRRDPSHEVSRAYRLEQEFQLTRSHRLSPWNWRVLDFDQAMRLLEELESRSQELGIEAIWDANSADSVRVIGSVTPRNVQVEVSRKRDWFGLNGSCKIGDQEFSLADLLNGVGTRPRDGYMEIQPGQWARISDELREKLQRLRDAAHRNRNQLDISPTAAPVVQELLETQIDFEAPQAWRECLARLDRAQKLNPSPPTGLRGTLRDYQIDGYRWMRRLAEWGVGGCLADDMGLGKTVQTLAVLIDRREAGPSLVVAPTSVGFNWVREAERFAPELKPHLYRDTDRSEFLGAVGPGDLVVCSYGLALRDGDALGKVRWGSLILDEAQAIKNSRSKTSQVIRSFEADWKLALTGTPMENHLGELWSIFRNVSPGLFGSWDEFRDRFAAPIERNDDEERRKALSQLIRPFVLRRTKTEVLKELPKRTEMNLYVELSDEERRRYDETRLAALGELEEFAGMPDTKDQRFRVLALLTRLRQLACHVGLVDAAWQGSSAKLDLLVETLTELRDEGHRALVFSQFTSHLALIRQALDAAGITYEYLDGSTPAQARQQRVDAFQSGAADAFLISLKAGGTGLNLTAADYVIHMDPWWNPAVEDQATDRAHRFGQTKPVMVYRIVAKGTIEEQILDLHDEKRDLVAGVMEGTHAAGRMGTDELVALIRSSR